MKYPCANSQCSGYVPVPGTYCPDCQRKITALVNKYAEDRQKQIDRERYERHKEDNRRREEE